MMETMVTISVTRNKRSDAPHLGWLTLLWEIPLVGEKYFPASYNAPSEGGWSLDEDNPPKLVNAWVAKLNERGGVKPLGLVDEDNPEKLAKLANLYPLRPHEISRALYWAS